MNRIVLVLVLVLGCRSGSGSGSGSGSIQNPSPSPSPSPSPILGSATQLITGVVDDWTATHATLRLWQRIDGKWQPVGEPWPAVIGATGAAWGAGLHGNGAPAGREGPLKREGDRKSPAGAFALRGAYGYAPGAPPGTKLAYTPVDTPWECVDDPASPHYAQIVDRERVEADWKSSELMRRGDELYTWVIDVAHNPARTPGAGSCIFLHVWHGADSTTVGCTAMAMPRLASLVAQLDPSALYVLLPQGEYRALAEPWGLPPQ